ncbi:hypothetical protein PIN31115_03829 [Pandoraea iniqua]|uniref:DUF2846 domain-containing protein n=2 Tax=Pandoraea iniqua TaxID=2508288 RepID=A0A5E4XFJ2_9BURK|nr:hypothetical protein PIN31115_03829 [Pandoraea iniqua]
MRRRLLSFAPAATLMAIALSATAQGAQAEAFVPCRWLGKPSQCISVPLESLAADGQAKTFVPPPADVARVYLVRSRTTDPRRTTPVDVGSTHAGDLAPMTYLVLDLPPGEHEFTGQADGMFGRSLRLEGGQTYFAELRLTQWLNTMYGAIDPMPAAAGQRAVAGARLARASDGSAHP